MKKYALAGTATFLAFGWSLLGNGAKITALITGKDVFVSSKDLTPGTFRKITVPICRSPCRRRGAVEEEDSEGARRRRRRD